MEVDKLKLQIGTNISMYRKRAGLTQAGLAEKLNYSDKTISKWERAESSPDISILVDIADIFGVSLDYLVRSENIEETVRENRKSEKTYNRKVITYMSETIPVAIALFAFIITSLVTKTATFQWLYFIYTLPIVLIIKLVFNSIWFNPRHNYIIISALIWSILATKHITFLYFHINVALIYLLGVVGQVVVILWSFIKKT